MSNGDIKHTGLTISSSRSCDSRKGGGLFRFDLVGGTADNRLRWFWSEGTYVQRCTRDINKRQQQKQFFEISLNRCGSCYARTVFVSVVVVAVGVVLA